MRTPTLLDIAPDPVSTGIAVVVVLFVVGLVLLMVGALAFFLWYRKRSLRGSEMIRPASPSTAARIMRTVQTSRKHSALHRREMRRDSRR